MSDIRSSEVALTGIRFVRANPSVVAIWAGVYLLAAFSGIAALIFMAGAEVNQLQRLPQDGAEAGAGALGLLGRVAPAFALLAVATCAAFSVAYAGTARAVLRPEDKAGAYLRLGGDELRQFLLFLLMMAVAIGAYLAATVAAVAVFVGGAMLLRDAGGGGVAIGVLVGFAAAIAALCGAIYCAVRLSLASPLTFDQRRVNLFGSWALTRGRFWPMFGAYALAWVLAMIVNAAAVVINLAVAGVGGGATGLMRLGAPDWSSLAAYLSTAAVVALAVNAAASALMWPILLMPASEIYRQIAGDNPADAF